MPTEIVFPQMLAQGEGLHDADSEQADRSAGRLTSQPWTDRVNPTGIASNSLSSRARINLIEFRLLNYW